MTRTRERDVGDAQVLATLLDDLDEAIAVLDTVVVRTSPLSRAALLFVSCPSTRRAALALDRDGGADVGEPSTNAFVALPQPTESTTSPAGSRSARPRAATRASVGGRST
jgi:hypothetical protein